MHVTVIIATYGDQNWADLARSRALPSASAQTHPAEILIGHDPDGTIATVRNGLAERALSEWLCFLDADDELAPSYLGAMQRAYEQRKAGALRSPDGRPPLLTPAVQQIRKGQPGKPAFYPEVPLRDANWLIVGTLIHRDLFFEVGGFPDYPHGFEDAALWSKAHRLGAPVVKVPKAVYIQHVNPHSKHRQGWRDRRWQVETHQRVYRELDEWEAALA